MKIELTKVSEAVQEAATTAREMPEAEISTIVNLVVGQLGAQSDSEPEPEPGIKKVAHDRLHAAADQLRQEGDTEQAPLVNALIGIGLAILATGEDAEMYYAGQSQ